MTTCTFIGSNQYDLNLYERIQIAVKDIVSKENEIEFLFYRRTMKFYHFCFLAVLKMKHQFPNKSITLTLFTNDIKEENPIGIKPIWPPTWAFDKIIPISFNDNTIKSGCIWNKIERKIIQECNYVIANCYPELHGIEYNLFKYASNQTHIFISNITEKETIDFIKETINKLSFDERHILEQIDAGCTYTDLAKNMCMSKYLVKAENYRVRKYLRNHVMKRFQEYNVHSESPSNICSIISLNKSSSESYEIHRRLQTIIDFLTESINITTFMIMPTDFLAMNKLSKKESNLELIIVTHSSEPIELDSGYIQKQHHVPPYAKMMYIDTELKPMWARDLFITKSMIAQSDYVICNLNGTPAMNDRIRRYIVKQKNIAVIDLQKTPYISNHYLLV